MDFGAKMRSKGDPKSRNLGDISRPLARGGQMGLQGLQNDAKMVPKGCHGGAKMDPLDAPVAPQDAPDTTQDAPKTPQDAPEMLQRRPKTPQRRPDTDQGAPDTPIP